MPNFADEIQLGTSYVNTDTCNIAENIFWGKIRKDNF